MSRVHTENKTNVSEKIYQKKADGITDNTIQHFSDERAETQVQLKQQSLMKQAADNNLRNNTGLPNQLKAGIESLSGMSLNHVKVHYNSNKPAQLNAHAYAQGSNIHLAPGQEKHLPHETWHVIQQAQGRVKPTMQMKAGVPVNNDSGLEQEADVMGEKALGIRQFAHQKNNGTVKLSASTGTIQCKYPSDEEVKDKSAMRFSTFFGGNIRTLGPEVDSEQLVLEVASGKQWIYERVKNRYHPANLPRRTAVDIEYVAPIKPDKLDNFDLNEIGAKSQSIHQQMNSPKAAYVGGGIVWVGESSIDTLVKRYVEETQDWTLEQRKERLGVVFGINDKEKLDTSANTTSENRLNGKVDSVMNSISNKVNAHIFGFKWGVKWNVPGFGEIANTTLRTALDEGTMNNELIEWEMDNRSVENSVAKFKFNEDLKEVNIPYGALRNMVTSSDGLSKVENDLKKNNANTVFFHSVDADAPSFETIATDGDDGYLKVLDAYSAILENYEQDKEPTMLIGGYNLLEDINEKTNLFDWYHTARSNVVDIAVREAAVGFAPNLVYPTEPNFLIKMDMINKLKKNTKTGAWGVGASEGWELMRQTIEQLKTDKNLTKKTKNDPNILNPLLKEQIAYNPMASVPTGTEAGGIRLKVMGGKKYDENSIKGKPISSNLNQGDTVPVSEQYVVQAQSWSGASRLATAYQRAIGTMGASIKADAVTPLLEPVESMVLQLYAGSKPTFDSTAIKQAITKEPVKTANTKIDLEKLILAIQASLIDLQSSEEWQALNDLQPKE